MCWNGRTFHCSKCDAKFVYNDKNPSNFVIKRLKVKKNDGNTHYIQTKSVICINCKIEFIFTNEFMETK